VTPDDRTTRERLISGGLRLFAQRGFRGTTVGDIEAAAGLAPRRGALYKHFGSKQALLEAAVERHIVELRSIGDVIDLMPLGDIRAELTLLVRWLLIELDRQREVCLVLEKEGGALLELRDRFFDEVVSVGYRLGAEFVRRHVKELPGVEGIDAEAVAVAAVGAIVSYRRTQWTFGHTPLDFADERFVDGFVDLFGRMVDLAREQGGRDA
jgi:AcrR family transcriptional regulator